jgi:hypothetical protein
MRPKDFGPWETGYGDFRRWRRAGGWERVMTELRQVERQCQGRLGEPSAGAIDSQSVKTATQSKEGGLDGNKKIKGRKRPLLVDTRGLIVAGVVTAANVEDRLGLMALLHHYLAEGGTRLRQLWVETGATVRNGCTPGCGASSARLRLTGRSWSIPARACRWFLIVGWSNGPSHGCCTIDDIAVMMKY